MWGSWAILRDYFFLLRKTLPCGSPSPDLYKEKLVQGWERELIHFKEDRPAALVSGDRFLWNIILIKNACVKPLRIKRCVQQHFLSSCKQEGKTNVASYSASLCPIICWLFYISEMVSIYDFELGRSGYFLFLKKSVPLANLEIQKLNAHTHTQPFYKKMSKSN